MLTEAPESPLTHLTNEELVDLLDENFFTLLSTGMEALSNATYEVAQGIFLTAHGLSDERMGLVLVLFARRMSNCWDIPANTYYKKGN